MGTMDTVMAPIANIKFDIEVALGKRESRSYIITIF
jgi:hypothetical protein